MGFDWIGYGYAVLVASGGIIGYAKAGSYRTDAVPAWLPCELVPEAVEGTCWELSLASGSVPSLAAGLLFGGLAGLGAHQLSQDPKNVWLSLIASGTLAGLMGVRFYSSGKFMPAGLIAGASLLMVGRLGLKMYEKPHEG